MKTDIPAWYWRIWPQFNIGIYNVDIYKQLYNRKYKNITVGTQVMTINTTARMATADYGNQKYQLSTCIGCGFTSHSTFQLYINYQLALAVGSQAIQRFNFISTNFQPSTDNVNWFCCNTDNSTLVLHCISKYIKSS